jgi:hypothetical protein
MAKHPSPEPALPTRKDRWLLLFALALGACASTSVDELRLYPVTGVPTETVIQARLTRSCQLGDCRLQHASVTMPDGEVLQGEVQMLGAASDAATIPQAAAGPLGSSGETGERVVGMPATMTLRSDRGTHMRCELTLSRTGRRASGLCWSSRGQVFRLEL